MASLAILDIPSVEDCVEFEDRLYKLHGIIFVLGLAACERPAINWA